MLIRLATLSSVSTDSPVCRFIARYAGVAFDMLELDVAASLFDLVVKLSDKILIGNGLVVGVAETVALPVGLEKGRRRISQS